MRALCATLVCTLLLAAGAAEAGDRRHDWDRSARHGQHLIIPPGSKVIIIPPPQSRFGYSRDRWPRRDLHWNQDRGFDRRVQRPGFGTRLHGFTTPGFSHGWTTPPGAIQPRRGW